MSEETFFSNSAEETISIGYNLGKTLLQGDVICFKGELAAGKTTFIKGLAAGALKINSEEVTSPTFVYLNIYEGSGSIKLYHFDLYRIEDKEDFITMGFEEYLHQDGVCLIEWSERIEDLIPPNNITITIEHFNNSRKITIKR